MARRAQLAVGLVHVTCDLLGPQFMKELINYVTRFGAGDLRPMPTSNQAIGWLTMVIALWAIVSVVSFVLQRATIIIMTRAGESVQFTVTDGIRLVIRAESCERKYQKNVLLPAAVNEQSAVSCYANGVLELRLWKV
jgi:hypothetical protein